MKEAVWTPGKLTFLSVTAALLGALIFYILKLPISEYEYQKRDFCKHLTDLEQNSFGHPIKENDKIVRYSSLNPETLAAIRKIRWHLECDGRRSTL